MTLWHTPKHVLETLTDEATFYVTSLNPDWTPEDDTEPREVETVLWEGPASLSSRGHRISSSVEPVRAVSTDILRVPTPDAGGPGPEVKANTMVRLRDQPNVFVVADNRRRTTSVLQRFNVVDSEFADQVPR